MRIISRSRLKACWEKHPTAKGPLSAWYDEARRSEWNTPQDIVDHFPYVDILPGNRAVFNIKGNDFRLVVVIHYNAGRVYIRFAGTHAEYDRIDAKTI